MTADEAGALAGAWLTERRGEPCAVLAWSAREARTHWRFYWNTTAAIEGREVASKGVDAVCVDKRTRNVLLDPERRSPRDPVNAVYPAPPPGPVRTQEQAAAIAQAWLDATMEHWSSIVSARELHLGWAFFWNTDAFLRTGALEDTLGGNGPLVVLRDDGALHTLGTARPFDVMVAELETELGRG